MGASDAAIISTSLDEPTCFAQIFDRHAAAVRRFAIARVGPSTAEDIASEVFRIAFERRGSFDVQATSALPWLYGIAINLVRREMRGRARSYAAIERFGGRRELTGDGGPDVGDRIDAREELLELREALTALTADEVDVLLLVAWEQLSPTEAAEVLGIPAETARTRLHRARRRIRNHPVAQPAEGEVASDAIG